jgi:hypothetical protein
LSAGKKGGTIARTVMVDFMDGRGRIEHYSELSNSRAALYNVYDVFDDIHGRLKDEGDEDHAIFQKLVGGNILPKDPRFDELRELAKKNRIDDVKPIRLTQLDNEWLRDSFIARFIMIESEILPKLRQEVQQRVAQRKRGLEAIFAETRPSKRRHISLGGKHGPNVA